MKNVAIASLDKALNRTLKFLIEKQFNPVEIELNGTENSLLKEQSIDLLLVDSSTIDDEHLNLIKILKKIHTSLPIIVLYDLNAPKNFEKDLFNIADAMFRKPFTNQQLLGAIQDFLNVRVGVMKQ